MNLSYRAATVGFVLVCAAASCVTGPTGTPSGQAEATFVNLAPNAVRAELAQRLAALGFQLRQDTPAGMLFERPRGPQGPRRLAPIDRTRFTFSQNERAVRVVADVTFVGNPGARREWRADGNATPLAYQIHLVLQSIAERPVQSERLIGSASDS